MSKRKQLTRRARAKAVKALLKLTPEERIALIQKVVEDAKRV
jgi:hypothetical protein